MEQKKRKTYRNFTRSEKAIIRAYVELMYEKNGGKITVTDIVNKADLNRSTFYAHFKAADDVRDRIHSDVIDRFTNVIKSSDSKNALSDPRPILQNIFEFINSDADIYKMLLRTEGASRFLKSLEDMVIEWYLTDEVILPQIKDRDEFEMLLRMFIGGFISVLQDWAAGELKVPIERAHEMIETLIKRITEIYQTK